MNRSQDVIYKKIWVTWESQRRNISLSNELGIKLFQFDVRLNPVFRYAVSLYKTIVVFIKEKPSVIFVQNPSLILAFLAVHYGKILNIPIVVDAHNAGLSPFDGQKKWANIIALDIIKNATVTIVTNENLKGYVERLGGRALVFPDPIPEFSHSTVGKKLNGKINILFICTYASDEPYLEVIKAARELGKEVFIYITGKSKGKEKEFNHLLSENVILTGFISEHDYVQMLHSVDIIIDLTTREDCLVCGAYEAIAAEKPMILSDTKALRGYFYKGALYVDNTSKDLVIKINEAISSLVRLKKEVTALKTEKINDGLLKKNQLDEYLKRIKVS